MGAVTFNWRPTEESRYQIKHLSGEACLISKNHVPRTVLDYCYFDNGVKMPEGEDYEYCKFF